MRITRFLTVLFAFALLFNISCSSDSITFDESPITYQNGYFIANEGNFNSYGANIMFLTRDLSLKQDNIYAYNNGSTEPLGDVLQTIAFNGNNAYLVMNNSNKIVIVDRFTFKKVGEIKEQLNNPRGIAFANGFIYVVNNNLNVGGAKSVTKYKISDKSFVKKIDFTESIDKVVEAGGNIFVQNATFGYGNKITYINTSTDATTEISIPNGDINRTISYNSDVYTISATTTDSYIYKISSTGALTPVITLTGIANGTNLQIDNDKFYFSSANKVYTTSVKNPTVPSSPLLTAADGGLYYTLYGFSVIDGRIFASNVKEFQSNSELKIYSATSGAEIYTIKDTGGRGANGVFLNQ
ncbi:DUF5074 domain-containing protein [Chryseobacterium sp. 22458]|uniref:DUF5074 domain-containing protein n=1 Tax=Chryseobacterium sp. 22458 TaxID=3453921 RepID=UPI003F85DDB2